MKNNLDKIFPKSKSDLLEFCCHDPGYFSGLIITDKSCFISIRMGDDTPLQGGYCLNIQNNLSKRMLNFFNDMFKNNYRGKSEEYAILIEFIEGLQEHFSVT